MRPGNRFRVAQLRRVTSLRYGDSLAADARVDGTVPVYGSNGRVGTHNVANAHGPVIVIGRKGSYGKVQYVDEPVFAIDTTFTIDRQDTNANLRWLHYALSTLGLDQLTADVGVPGLSRERAYEKLIPIPDLWQQRAIADYLDTETARIDALIAKKRELCERLAEQFESCIFAAVTQGLRGAALVPSTVAWTPTIPEGWGTPTVSANFDVQLGKMLSAKAAAGPDQHPYLRNVNVQWDRVELDDLITMHFSESDKIRFALRRGDLLVCEGGEVGRAAIWDRPDDACLYQKALHRLRPRGASNSRFLMYVLRAAAKVNVFAVEGNLSTIVHLTKEQLSVHRFPWPPTDEQFEIVAHLDDVATRHKELGARIEEQIRLLKEHRQALITAAVTGELEIPGAA